MDPLSAFVVGMVSTYLILTILEVSVHLVSRSRSSRSTPSEQEDELWPREIGATGLYICVNYECRRFDKLTLQTNRRNQATNKCIACSEELRHVADNMKQISISPSSSTANVKQNTRAADSVLKRMYAESERKRIDLEIRG